MPLSGEAAPKLSWEACLTLGDAARGYVDLVRDKLWALLEGWDQDFADLGGDPTRVDWSDLPGLRRPVEERWSDWLAYLLRHSESGTLSQRLFGHCYPGRECVAFARPKVIREDNASSDDDRRRADISIFWSPGDAAHVEVKIDDQYREKTFETGRILQEKYRKPMKHFILLKGRDLPAWQAESKGRVDPTIDSLTWRGVAAALRDALLAVDAEPTRWRVWAHAFLGAIEQRILLQPRIAYGVAELALRDVPVLVLNEGLHRRVSSTQEEGAMSDGADAAQASQRFVEEGMRLYLRIQDTRTLFHEKLAAILKDTLGERKEWFAFMPGDVSGPTFSEQGEGQLWLWVGMGLTTAAGGSFSLSLGVVWRTAMNQGDAPAVYADVVEEVAKRPPVVGFSARPGAGIKVHARRYLYATVQEAAEIGPAADLVLSEAVAQLGDLLGA